MREKPQKTENAKGKTQNDVLGVKTFRSHLKMLQLQNENYQNMQFFL